jgi:hypothetical protein
MRWESCPRIKPQLVGSADLFPGDHDLPRVGRRDCPERLVVVPAVVAPGIHRVANDTIARAKSDEHRAFAIGEGHGTRVGSRLRSRFDPTRRLASPSIYAESWLLLTGSFLLACASEEPCDANRRGAQCDQRNPHAQRPQLVAPRGYLLRIRGCGWKRSRARTRGRSAPVCVV